MDFGDAFLSRNDGPSLIGQAAVPKSHAGNHCLDCGVPISVYSRGRCRTCAYLKLKRPVPDDFIAVLRCKGSVLAADHYRTSASTITRWRRELDLRPHMRAKKRTGPIRRMSAFTERPLVQHKDWSLIGQAAEFLRHIGPVFRCLASGAAAEKGEFWNRNGFVLTDDDLMSRAHRLGWVPVEI